MQRRFQPKTIKLSKEKEKEIRDRLEKKRIRDIVGDKFNNEISNRLFLGISIIGFGVGLRYHFLTDMYNGIVKPTDLAGVVLYYLQKLEGSLVTSIIFYSIGSVLVFHGIKMWMSKKAEVEKEVKLHINK